jgi:hypothetical protein
MILQMTVVRMTPLCITELYQCIYQFIDAISLMKPDAYREIHAGPDETNICMNDPGSLLTHFVSPRDQAVHCLSWGDQTTQQRLGYSLKHVRPA